MRSLPRPTSPPTPLPSPTPQPGEGRRHPFCRPRFLHSKVSSTARRSSSPLSRGMGGRWERGAGGVRSGGERGQGVRVFFATLCIMGALCWRRTVHRRRQGRPPGRTVFCPDFSWRHPVGIRSWFGGGTKQQTEKGKEQEYTIDDLIVLEKYDEAAERLKTRIKLNPQ